MPKLIEPLPHSEIELVTDVLHGIPVADPYRWLEDQNSPRTRAWIAEQTRYARSYLDNIPGRERIRERVGELLDVETYDSFVKSRNRYFFRKRLRGQEQPSIYFREGPEGEDQLLVDPTSRSSGPYTAVKPVRVSPAGSLLLYEVKHGGERAGGFEIVNVATRERLSDSLPHGYLRGFAFAPDGRSFYYSHETTSHENCFYRSVFHHVLGTDGRADREIFHAGEDEKLRLVLVSGPRTLGFLAYRFLESTTTDFYLWAMDASVAAVPILRGADYLFAPRLIPGRVLALVDENAPNRRIVDLQARKNQNPRYFDVVPERDVPIHDWAVTANHIVVLYREGTDSRLAVFDHFGKRVGDVPMEVGSTVRIVATGTDDDELLLEQESFTRPIEILRCNAALGTLSRWVSRSVPLDSSDFDCAAPSFRSTDGTIISVSLAGRSGVLACGTHPAVMTCYGGFGASSTPQFSVLVAFLIERGCLFALPHIRGGSELGVEWHNVAKRRNRQVSFDDFLAASEWLIQSGRTCSSRLAILGGSNSGLLVGAALTQRPDLFRAVLCLAPILDMLRFHLFDGALVWKDEFGTADDALDFKTLLGYSPYHAVRYGTPYPATMIVSGDADQNCNPLHARKMTARLQAANSSKYPIFIDYSRFRGHSPVLPLRERAAALTDRIAFLCDQLQLPT